MRVSTTKLQNAFGKYLQLALDDNEIIITKNNRGVAKLVKLSSDEVKEEAAKYESDKLITYDSFIALTNSNDSRRELIDGEIYLLASPSFEHQNISMNLITLLLSHFHDKKCRPFVAPLDITLKRSDVSEKSKSYKNVVQPDLMVICDKENTDGIRYVGIPELVIEILSPATRSKDMVKKLDLYMVSGIKEYWVVDPKGKQVMIYSFKEYDLEDTYVYHHDDIIGSLIYSELEMPLNDLFV